MNSFIPCKKFPNDPEHVHLADRPCPRCGGPGTAQAAPVMPPTPQVPTSPPPRAPISPQAHSVPSSYSSPQSAFWGSVAGVVAIGVCLFLAWHAAIWAIDLVGHLAQWVDYQWHLFLLRMGLLVDSLLRSIWQIFLAVLQILWGLALIVGSIAGFWFLIKGIFK